MKPQQLIEQIQAMLKQGLINKNDNITLDTFDGKRWQIERVERVNNETVLVARFDDISF